MIETLLHKTACAVVAWWDMLDTISADEEVTVACTEEMERRINLLREALEDLHELS
jgi:hypothetical protein